MTQPWLKEVYDYIGSINFERGEHKKAVDYFFKVEEAWLMFGDSCDNLIGYYQSLGKAYEHINLLEEAVKFYEKALEISSKKVDKNEKEIKECLRIVVERLTRLGRQEDVIKISEKYRK